MVSDNPGQAGTEAADPPHDQVDLDALLGGPVTAASIIEVSTRLFIFNTMRPSVPLAASVFDAGQECVPQMRRRDQELPVVDLVAVAGEGS